MIKAPSIEIFREDDVTLRVTPERFEKKFGPWDEHLAVVARQEQEYSSVCGYRQEAGKRENEDDIVHKRQSGLLANRTMSCVLFNSPEPHDALRDFLFEIKARTDLNYDFCGIPMVDVKSREYLHHVSPRDFFFLVLPQDWCESKIFVTSVVHPSMEFVDFMGLCEGRQLKFLDPEDERSLRLHDEWSGHVSHVPPKALYKRSLRREGPSYGQLYSVLSKMLSEPNDPYGCRACLDNIVRNWDKWDADWRKYATDFCVNRKYDYAERKDKEKIVAQALADFRSRMEMAYARFDRLMAGEEEEEEAVAA